MLLSKIRTAFDYYRTIWRPAEVVVSDMEARGVLLDGELCPQKYAECLEQLAGLDARLTAWARQALNWGSPKQLAQFLYGTRPAPAVKGGEPIVPKGFALPPVSGTLRAVQVRDEDDSPTGAAALRYLADHARDPADRAGLETLLAWKDKSKLASFWDTLPDHVRPDGRIHPQLGPNTETGRLSCVAATTRVEMPRDMVKHPLGVPITEVRAGDWVYAFDWQRDLVLRKVLWVGQTGVRETVTVTVRNSEGHELSFRATPEHLVRLRSGDWRPAGSLMHQHGAPHRTDGPRVMTMVRRGWHEGYLSFFPHSVARGNGSLGGGRSKEHRWVAGAVRGRCVSTKSDVHHVDGNPLNNSPDNLEVLPLQEHRGNREHHPEWGSPRERVSLYSGPTDYRVVSVTPGLVEPVWDMEVDEAHNFIANGVCVHNCRNPNLQQQPKATREAFVAKPGHLLIALDYSGLEWRVLAHCLARKGDRSLVEEVEAGIDPHSATAVRMGLCAGPVEGVKANNPKARDDAKVLNYSINYGKTGRGLGVQLRGKDGNPIGEEAGQALLDGFYEARPGIAQFHRDIVRYARATGGVRSLLGRYRAIPELEDERRWMQFRGERLAKNVIQNCATDIVVLAMLRVNTNPELKGEGWFSPVLAGLDCELLLQNHDELLFEVPEANAEEARVAAADIMANCLDGIREFLCPLEVSGGIGKNWKAAGGK